VARAYDECWREGALSKIKNLGIKGNMYNYIQNFMTERYFSVQVKNDVSDKFEQQNGIPQGAVISPTIFTIMVNDLGEECTDLKNHLSQFADDSAIWRTGRNLQHTSKALQKQLDKVASWMEKWGFQLNANKSVAMIFSRGRISRNIKLDINKIPIQVVNSTTFLDPQMT
jgi:hypothetical protein